jgi:hypothetical protein
LNHGRIQFRDAGFQPALAQSKLTLGPEQMAVSGFGEYAKPNYDLGVQEDVVIPKTIRPLKADFGPDGTNSISATVAVPPSGDVRILFRQSAGPRSKPLRSSRGAPPNGTTLDKILQITVLQNGRPLPLQIQYDKALWSGLSWAVGEIRHRDLKSNSPITIRCVSAENQSVQLKAELYAVEY